MPAVLALKCRLNCLSAWTAFHRTLRSVCTASLRKYCAISRRIRPRTRRRSASSTEEGLELVIADDGKGFSLTETRGLGGLGLISLDERVRLVGGSLAINTEPQRGTEVRVQVPLEGNRTTAGIA